jgi:hypothetical protein
MSMPALTPAFMFCAMDTAEFLLEARRWAAMDVILSAAALAAPHSRLSDSFVDRELLGNFEMSIKDLVTCQVALRSWEGASWDAIGGHLGCSRQAAYQRFGKSVNYLLQYRTLPTSISSMGPDEQTEAQLNIEYWMDCIFNDWKDVRKEAAAELRKRRAGA